MGLAVLASAQKHDLDFLHLFEERFDLVIPDDVYSSAMLTPLLDHLTSGDYLRTLDSLDGYDARQAGREISIQ